MTANWKKTFLKIFLLIFFGFLIGVKYGAPNFLLNLLRKKEKVELQLPREPVPNVPLPNANVPDNYLSFPQVVSIAKPAVVNIDTKVYVEEKYIDPFGDDFGSDPFFKYFFKDFKDQKPQIIPQEGKGSGFIIDKKGLILTNYHVVNGAKEITVKLSDGRKFKAEIKGKDKKLDVAILKIDAKSLTSIHLGDSKKVQLGEWVIAIGNPFGFEQTVTAGIISGKGRTINEDMSGQELEDLIQTDASINRGNSGGPLVNLKGEVIGMNTAIYTPSGGSVGIGFAIPINTIKAILKDLVNKGKVIRPWIGIYIQGIDKKLIKPLRLNLKDTDGAMIMDIAPKSPAEKAGLQRYDIILEINRKKIKNAKEVVNEVKKYKIGDTLAILVLRPKRDGSTTTNIYAVTLGEMP